MDDIGRANRLAEQQRQISINAALQRGIETEQPDEENGIRYCLDCGEEIAPERLAVRPESVRCVDCKQIKDKRGHEWKQR
jgi:DnaK suppressor protein